VVEEETQRQRQGFKFTFRRHVGTRAMFGGVKVVLSLAFRFH